MIKDTIDEILKKIFGDQLKAIYNKSESTIPYKAKVNPENGYTFGKSETRIALENGLKFRVDWEKGQKTGFFVDQRDNRAVVGKIQ